MSVAREKYKGVLIGNMGYTAEEAEQAITEGKLGTLWPLALAFGQPGPACADSSRCRAERAVRQHLLHPRCSLAIPTTRRCKARATRDESVSGCLWPSAQTVVCCRRSMDILESQMSLRATIHEHVTYRPGEGPLIEIPPGNDSGSALERGQRDLELDRNKWRTRLDGDSADDVQRLPAKKTDHAGLAIA